ncbi:hypothetical protein [Mycoplasma sp. SG1]|uniref:hypothetical protein n=1 Tax=Mycoplasma sp. SG1 TaxID=2810348 RepID=UPI002023D70E|nr:hypothetical protein [Mycoplasma sp. SG1]URM52755.1 hypothetical protein JRW51_00135 [Mycoplasma sp. SG1]
MKKQIKFLPLLILPLLFAGCNNSGHQHKQSGGNTPVPVTPKPRTPITPIDNPKFQVKDILADITSDVYSWIENSSNKISGFDPSKNFEVQSNDFIVTQEKTSTKFIRNNLHISICWKYKCSSR